MNVKPESFDLPGGMGKIYVSGAVTAIGFAEDDRIPGDRPAQADISNAQVFVQKVDGEVQFFAQAGEYSLPSLGAGYLTGANATNLYGPLPQAFLKIVPDASFSIEAGKLPTLIGAEYTFTYENMNIFRGLLWNQETAISRGIQANYTAGPVALAVQWSDGFYSNRYNWLAGSAAWTINSSNTLALIVSGNLGVTDYSASAAVPFVQNNDQQLDNLIYTYTSGPVLAQGYIQYSNTSKNGKLGFGQSASQTGEGVLVNYAVPNTSYNLSTRVEYNSSTGSVKGGAPNVMYGPGSDAWSFTFTPSWQSGVFFTRAEVSYVSASKTTKGFVFGPNGTQTSQTRFAIETGILF
ncbi:MAG TPA: outer membrane beta-barrel protein [Opitutaceae bacterium]|nr:outer membrane beta-barrel protein [Opitutaceae bacterium]